MLAEKEQGRGKIRLHFVPLMEGTIFNASFALNNPLPGNLILNLSAVQDGLKWHISAGGTDYEEQIPLNYLENSGFITALINFEIARDHFTVNLSLENPEFITEERTIPLSAPMSGKGVFRFGTGTMPVFSGRELAGRSVSITNDPFINASVAILNELAVSYAVEAVPDERPEPEPLSEETLSEEIADVPAFSEGGESIEAKVSWGESTLPNAPEIQSEGTAEEPVSPAEQIPPEEGEISPEQILIKDSDS
jgi:hypothetical protein